MLFFGQTDYSRLLKGNGELGPRQLGPLLRQLGPPYGQLGPLFKDNSDQYLV